MADDYPWSNDTATVVELKLKEIGELIADLRDRRFPEFLHELPTCFLFAEPVRVPASASLLNLSHKWIFQGRKEIPSYDTTNWKPKPKGKVKLDLRNRLDLLQSRRIKLFNNLKKVYAELMLGNWPTLIDQDIQAVRLHDFSSFNREVSNFFHALQNSVAEFDNQFSTNGPFRRISISLDQPIVDDWTRLREIVLRIPIRLEQCLLERLQSLGSEEVSIAPIAIESSPATVTPQKRRGPRRKKHVRVRSKRILQIDNRKWKELGRELSYKELIDLCDEDSRIMRIQRLVRKEPGVGIKPWNIQDAYASAKDFPSDFKRFTPKARKV